MNDGRPNKLQIESDVIIRERNRIKTGPKSQSAINVREGVPDEKLTEGTPRALRRTPGSRDLILGFDTEDLEPPPMLRTKANAPMSPTLPPKLYKNKDISVEVAPPLSPEDSKLIIKTDQGPDSSLGNRSFSVPMKVFSLKQPRPAPLRRSEKYFRLELKGGAENSDKQATTSNTLSLTRLSESISYSSQMETPEHSLSVPNDLKLDIDHVEVDNKQSQKKSSIEHLQEIVQVERSGAINLKQDILKIMELGSGSSGVVHLGLHVPTLRLVAVKEQRIGREDERKRLMKELQAIHRNLIPMSQDRSLQWSFDHYKAIGGVHPCPYLVGYYGAWATLDQSKVYLVMEFMDSGTLEAVVQSGGVRSEVVLKRIAFCCLKGLSYLREHNTIHRDIKPENLLINHTGMTKIADLGVATKVMKRPISKIVARAGTLTYYSPERINGNHYSFPADVWGLGVSLLSLCNGSHPFIQKEDRDEGISIFGLKEEINSADVTEIFARSKDPIKDLEGESKASFSEGFQYLVSKMMEKNPKRRPSAKLLLQHTYFTANQEEKKKDVKLAHKRMEFFQKEWKNTIRKTSPMGHVLLNKIKTSILESKRFSRWFATAVGRIKSRSSHQLLPPPDQNKIERTASSPAKLQGISPCSTSTGWTEPPMVMRQASWASMTRLDQIQGKFKKDTVEAIGESAAAQLSLWESFENLAGAVVLTPMQSVSQCANSVHTHKLASCMR